MRKIRSGSLVVAVLVLLGACSDDQGRSGASPVADERVPCYERGWRECPEEPYPFSTPVPPPEPTAIDGTYTRVVDVDLAGGHVKCARCAPYRLEPGTDTLVFDRGRFFLEHDPPGFRSSGHFWVEGDRLRLFNDPNCVKFEGIYEWNLSGEVLRLEAVEDDCPFAKLRQRNLMATEWDEAGTATVSPECYPPNEEAGVSGHWPIPKGCTRAS